MWTEHNVHSSYYCYVTVRCGYFMYCLYTSETNDSNHALYSMRAWRTLLGGVYAKGRKHPLGGVDKTQMLSEVSLLWKNPNSS